MYGYCRSLRLSANILIVFLVTSLIQEATSQDTTPPNVTCSDVTTHPLFVNSFFGLTEGVSYTYEDANPDPSGISYNVTTGAMGDLYPPGRTPVTLIAVDLAGNTATCLFHVENTLTELPVECPNINGTVATYHISLKYSFNVTIGPENVTKSSPQYRYHGGDVSVALGVRASPIGSVDDLGTYQLTIADDVLRKICEGPIRVLGRLTVATVVIIVMAAIAVIALISFISYRVVKAIKRSKAN